MGDSNNKNAIVVDTNVLIHDPKRSISCGKEATHFLFPGR